MTDTLELEKRLLVVKSKLHLMKGGPGSGRHPGYANFAERDYAHQKLGEALSKIPPGGGDVIADKAIARTNTGKYYVEGRKTAMVHNQAHEHLWNHHIKTGTPLDI